MKTKLMGLLAILITITALYFNNAASAFIFYQPKVPKALTK